MIHSEEKCEKKKKNRTYQIWFRMSMCIILIIVLALGISRAWFVNENDISTLVRVSEPSAIAIRGPHGEALSSLDMSYTDADKDGDKVTIRRVVSVSSDEQKHQLEIVHTTNLKGLTFKVYPATETTSVTDKSGSITEDNYTYKYDQNNPLSGEYINVDRSTEEYRYADNKQHKTNFDDYANVQIHAEPVYWLANGTQSGTLNDNKQNVNSKYLNYYVIEVSWTETEKETDIFYLLAKNA